MLLKFLTQKINWKFFLGQNFVENIEVISKQMSTALKPETSKKTPEKAKLHSTALILTNLVTKMQQKLEANLL